MYDRTRPIPTRRRLWARGNVLTTVLIIFIALSVLVNVYSLSAIYQTRRLLREQLQTAASKLDEARGETVSYQLPIQQSIPIRTTVQIDETLDIPVNTTVPVRQQISVPVDVPVVGAVNLPVNLNFDVPVSTTVRVAIKKSVPISTSIDLDTTFPIKLDLNQPPLGDVLRSLSEALRQILAQF